MDVNRIFKSFPKTPLLALLRKIRSNKLALLLARVASVPAKAIISKRASTKTPSQTKFDRPRKPPSIWKARLEKFMYKAGANISLHKLLMSIIIAVVIITVIASSLLFFAARPNKPVRQANKTTTAQTNKTVTEEPNETATVQASETTTAQVYPAYLSGNGTLAFFDPLNQEGEWSSELDPHGNTCQFTDGAYHVMQQQKGSFNSCANKQSFGNFAFEVYLTIVQGDCGGMILRQSNNGNSYYFHICQDSTYKFVKLVNNSNAPSPMHIGQSSAIHTGRGQQNKIAVVANSSTMMFYVNEQLVHQEQDSSYASGYIGLLANAADGNPTDVAYTNARVWTL